MVIAPVKNGQTLVRDVANTGIDIVATRTVPEKKKK
jgi:CxxC motif-containing protein